MNKICTSIVQSQKLIELGIDENTSDMVYLRSYFEEEEGEYNLIVGPYHEGYMEKEDGSIIPVFDEHIPAWSLTALMKLMPKVSTDGGEIYESYPIMEHDDEGFAVSSPIYNTSYYSEPIDAAFEMVCWLKENGKI